MHSKTNEPFHHTGEKNHKKHHLPSPSAIWSGWAGGSSSHGSCHSTGQCFGMCSQPMALCHGTWMASRHLRDENCDDWCDGQFWEDLPPSLRRNKNNCNYTVITVVRAVRDQAVYRSIPKSPYFYQWRSIVLGKHLAATVRICQGMDRKRKPGAQNPNLDQIAPAKAELPCLTAHWIPNETRGTIVIGEVIYRPNGVETPLQRPLQRDTRCIHHIPV